VSTACGAQLAGRTPDERAFERELVLRMPRIRAYARARASSWHDADDLLQQTFLKAWQARGSFTVGTNMDAWLATVMRNVFYDHFRRARVSADIDDHANDLLLARPATQEAAIALDELGRALDQLPQAQREAVLLIGRDGLSYDEAAERAAVPVGTVRSRVSRGRETLHSVLRVEEARIPY
jgi:RNA polymerase sigma-70 factor (ECF subfamily)